MRAVIICGGAISDYGYIKSLIGRDDLIICADSGYDHALKMSLAVDLVVGDFDSITHLPQDVACVRYPAKKDQTDTEIAIEQARQRGRDDFLLLAATGTRLDHTLANILLLKDFLMRKERAAIIDEHNKIMITDSVLSLREPKGSIVSLIPLTECFGVTSEGLEYPLNETSLVVGRSLGVSNIMGADCARISIRGGTLLVIVARD